MASVRDGEASELDPGITRRDFVGSTLIGTGAALLAGGCRSRPPPATVVSAWDGPGGVGDYAASNGVTESVMTAAHRIRDGDYLGNTAAVTAIGETYDVVIVGAGFGGLGALHAFRKQHPAGTCLVLDNQAVFGGYAKANEFDVDGYRVAGSQASMNFVLPATTLERETSYWSDLGLPEQFEWVEREAGNPAMRFPRGTSSALYHGEQTASTGYQFRNRATGGKHVWVGDVWKDDLARAALPPEDKAALLRLRDHKGRGRPEGAEAARLDGMTFADWATREMSASPDVLRFVTLGMCQTGPQISALAAQSLPGLDRFEPGSPQAAYADRFMSFPGGNSTIAKAFVKAAVPDAFRGPATFEGVADPLDLAALDKRGAAARIRLGATVVRVAHDGDPGTARRVLVTYAKGGRLFRVAAKSVVMCIGAWIAKHVVADLPDDRRAALDRFLYAPFLTVNVALRNWRFLDKLGYSTVRWSDGLGFFASVRQPMVVGGRAAPFHPDKPIVLTMYVPFPNPQLPLEAQGAAGRTQLLQTSYADYERQVVAQLYQLFGGAGFDARRDVAGIVLNRWGHAFVTAQPGFFHGEDSPLPVIGKPFGRILFGPTGLEDWVGAAHAGGRAVGQIAV